MDCHTNPGYTWGIHPGQVVAVLDGHGRFDADFATQVNQKGLVGHMQHRNAAQVLQGVQHLLVSRYRNIHRNIPGGFFLAGADDINGHQIPAKRAYCGHHAAEAYSAFFHFYPYNNACRCCQENSSSD
ncbi:hypothetical protein D3C71_1715210 [compost metagenome]